MISKYINLFLLIIFSVTNKFDSLSINIYLFNKNS